VARRPNINLQPIRQGQNFPKTPCRWGAFIEMVISFAESAHGAAVQQIHCAGTTSGKPVSLLSRGLFNALYDEVDALRGRPLTISLVSFGATEMCISQRLL